MNNLFAQDLLNKSTEAESAVLDMGSVDGSRREVAGGELVSHHARAAVESQESAELAKLQDGPLPSHAQTEVIQEEDGFMETDAIEEEDGFMEAEAIVEEDELMKTEPIPEVSEPVLRRVDQMKAQSEIKPGKGKGRGRKRACQGPLDDPAEEDLEVPKSESKTPPKGNSKAKAKAQSAKKAPKLKSSRARKSTDEADEPESEAKDSKRKGRKPAQKKAAAEAKPKPAPKRKGKDASEHPVEAEGDDAKVEGKDAKRAKVVEPSAGSDLENLKKSIKEYIRVFPRSAVVPYWTRPAVGLKVRKMDGPGMTQAR